MTRQHGPASPLTAFRGGVSSTGAWPAADTPSPPAGPAGAPQTPDVPPPMYVKTRLCAGGFPCSASGWTQNLDLSPDWATTLSIDLNNLFTRSLYPHLFGNKDNSAVNSHDSQDNVL